MVKPKKQTVVRKLFANSAIRALAVVVLTIGVGAVVLPQLFAVTGGNPVPYVSGLRATPGNGGNYGVRLEWSGYTPNNYVVKAIYGSTLHYRDTTTSKAYSFLNLRCGTKYRFEVYAANQNGGAVSSVAAVHDIVTACPSASFTRIAVNGNNLTAYWKNNNFASKYNLQFRVDGALYSRSTTAGQYSIASTCGKTYEFFLIPEHAGQSGSPTAGPAPNRFSTAACPAPPAGQPAPTPAPTPQTPAPPVRVNNGGSSNNNSNSAPSVNAPEPAGPPATPQNFAATVSTSKVIELSWDTAENASKYIISRSTDQQNWVQIAETDNTFYDDESADFETTYYYQVQAVNADGAISGFASTEATTEAFKASNSTITSGDKKASITIPDGAIDGDYSCTIGSKSNNLRPPSGQVAVLGPYSLTCITGDGDVVNEFAEPLNTTFKLGTSGEGYKDISVRVHDGRSWSSVRNISYNQNTQQIGFKLVKSDDFGVYGVKQKSSVWVIFLILFLLLAIAAVIFFILRRRRAQNDDGYGNYPVDNAVVTTSAAALPAATTPEEEFRQAVAQPDCSHLSMAQQVIPSSMGCQECEQQGTKWNSLRICLICGHVGCSDDSSEQHALKHYNETGHPLIYEYGNPEANSIGWCYIDQTYI